MRKILILMALVATLVACQPPASLTSGGPQWRLVFDDEFTADLSQWNVQHNSTFGDGNNEEQRYMRENATITDGVLTLRADPPIDGEYASGMVTTRAMGGPQKFAFTHGYAEVRARLPKGGGFWPAFWLVGAEGTASWPAYGEVDVFEFYGTFPDQVESNFHKTGGNIGARDHAINEGEWNTYGVNWTSTSLEWFVNGVSVRTWEATSAADLTSLGYAHVIILNLAVGGDGPRRWHGWDGTWAEGDLPAAFEIDYVRVWEAPEA